MSGINKCILVGNLGNDPEIRYTSDGTAIANISIATSESWKDKNTGQKFEKTEWHRCNAFEKLAETIGKYLKKGSKVYVEGSIHTRKWTDKQGQDKYSTEIKIRHLQMLDSRGSESQQQRPEQQAPDKSESSPHSGQPELAQQNITKNSFDDEFDDVDIPF